MPTFVLKVLLTIVLSIQGMLYCAAETSPQTLHLNDAETAWLQQNPSIRVGFYSHFPPYSYLNDNGEIEGFAVDVFRLLEKQIGSRMSLYSEGDWDSLLSAAKQAAVPQEAGAPHLANRPDIVATMIDMGSRRNWFEFTNPYIFRSLVVVGRGNDPGVQIRDDLAGKTVAMIKGYHYVEPLLNEFPSVKPLYVDNMVDALSAVSFGSADAAISYHGAVHHYRTKYLLSNLKYVAPFDNEITNLRIAIRKNAPELAAIIRKAMDAIPESELQTLRGKWLPVGDIEQPLVGVNLTQSEKAWIEQHREIRIGIDPEFAPFGFLSEDGYQGIAIDYIKLLNQRLNLNMQVVPGITVRDFDRLAKAREIDVLPTAFKTPKRQQYLNYTTSYLQHHRVIITRTDAPFVAGLEDLELLKLPIAAKLSTPHQTYLEKNSQAPLEFFSKQEEALLAVASGQIGAFVGNLATTTYRIRKLNLNNLKIAAPLPSEVKGLHFAVRKDWPELRSILQKGLDSISTSQRQSIEQKWLSVNYEVVVNYRLLWQLAGAFSVLIIAAFVWNMMLNRQVRLRTSQLDYTAKYDPISGLPNRVLIMDRLEQAFSNAKHSHNKIALLSIDIDNFKKVNDEFDHKTGDQLIKAISKRLKNALHDGDSIGHLSANHFLVIQSQLGGASDAALLTKNILDGINKGYTISGNEINISASIGIAIYPDGSKDPEELLKHANAATNHTKNHMHGGYTFYTKKLMQNVSRGLELDRYMSNALARGEFTVFYQPKVDAKSRRIISFEALLRWFSPELGAVPPSEFIPIAEKNGMIDSLGYFVIEQALSQLSLWHQRFDPKLSIAINLSPVQFLDHDLLPRISSTLLQYNIKGSSIEFEITEGVLLVDSPEGESQKDHPSVGEKLRQLAALGISLSMDDFGTGYSSMSYLRKYKFNSLKIDGEFIHDLISEVSDQKLVSATIGMAHGLGMEVVAERVETKDQSEWLTSANCDILQGWFFSKAMPAEDIDLLLEKQYTDNTVSNIHRIF